MPARHSRKATCRIVCLSTLALTKTQQITLEEHIGHMASRGDAMDGRTSFSITPRQIAWRYAWVQPISGFQIGITDVRQRVK